MASNQDKTGQKFGRLTVIGEVARTTEKPKMWRCECECGALVDLYTGNVGKTKSCGCLQREKAALQGKASATDRSGERTGRLLILRKVRQDRRSIYLCLCDCGAEIEAPGGDLRPGGTQSCGCLHREKMAQVNAANAKHGHAKGSRKDRMVSREYRSWQAMKQRCRNPNAPNFHLYGGRGITFCDRWLDFTNFLADMGDRPDGTTLDRIDNDGNYEPGNCRWAGAKAQSNNRRATPKLKAARKINLAKGRKHWPRKDKI